MLDLLVRLAVIALGVALGGLALVAGRRYLQVFVGIGAFLVALGVFAMALGYSNPWQLIASGAWLWVLVAVALGGMGLVVSRRYPQVAVGLAGFVAGATLSVWILLAYWQVVSLAQIPMWYGFIVLIVLVAGVALAYWTLRWGDEAIILVTTAVGLVTLSRILDIDPDSKWAAIAMLSLALVGVIIQYATLVRERHGLPPLTIGRN